MPPSAIPATLTVALVGNPNTGKSTLFSALVGIHQHVANYPGVTVEKKTGRMPHGGKSYEVIDLPGVYSLAPRSRDEMVTVDVLLGRTPDLQPIDAVLCIVDAANLSRNLYLVSQVRELGLPIVVALNMLDVAQQRGVTIDVKRFQQQLQLPVVAIQANRRLGIEQLKEALHEATARGPAVMESPLPAPFSREVAELEPLLAERCAMSAGVSPRFLAQRLLLDGNGYMEQALLAGMDGQFEERIRAARQRIVAAGLVLPDLETAARYEWASRVLERAGVPAAHARPTVSDRLDRLLTHRFLGTVLLLVVMVVVFQAVFAGADPVMRVISWAMDAVGDWVQAALPAGALRSLLVDGVIHGVGSVLVFLPQIAILFCFIAILEDCGYMARAAYLMDRHMVRVGLSGKSFLPLLSSFGCAVPAIMGARVVENDRDRLATILVAPLLTCSARLQVYVLLIAAFIPSVSVFGALRVGRFHPLAWLNLQGIVLASMYVLGTVAALTAAWVFKRTLLRGAAPLFVMELPSYKWPSPRTVLYRVVERCMVFLRCAGTLILAVAILVWAALYYPGGGKTPEHSLLAGAGRLIEPMVKPLGWDWRVGCAVIASFPAREVVVATLGVIFSPADGQEPAAEGDTSRLQTSLLAATWEGTNRPLFTVPTALSIMVFFTLCAQCAATLAIIRRETNSWRWPAFTLVYMTVLAYVGALITYQAGTWIACR